jgi:PLP dependent protein
MSAPHIDPRRGLHRLGDGARSDALGRVDPDAITICAVTKGFGVDAVRAALEAGLVDIGENYAQELVAKADDLAAEPGRPVPRWHMIGAVSATRCGGSHPTSRSGRPSTEPSSAPRSPSEPPAPRAHPGERHGEPAKAGVRPMGLPPGRGAHRPRPRRARPHDGRTDRSLRRSSRPAFDRSATLADQLGLPVRSMGMSGDLETAVGLRCHHGAGRHGAVRSPAPGCHRRSPSRRLESGHREEEPYVNGLAQGDDRPWPRRR